MNAVPSKARLAGFACIAGLWSLSIVNCQSGGGAQGDEDGEGGGGSEQDGGGGGDHQSSDDGGSGGGSEEAQGGQAGSFSAMGGADGMGGSPAAGGAGTGGAQAMGGASGMGGMNMGGAAMMMGGSPAATPCNALLCEDFETGVLSPKWRATATGATVDMMKPANGKYAAHFHVRPMTSGTTIRLVDKFPHKGPLYAAMNMHHTPHHNFGHTYLFRAGEMEFGGQFGGWLIAPLGKISSRQGAYPAGKWVCVQWEMTENPATIKLKLDGQEVATGVAAGTTTVPTYEPLQLGFKTYHPEDVAEVHVYLDDIKFDSKPVPCPKKPQ